MTAWRSRAGAVRDAVQAKVLSLARPDAAPSTKADGPVKAVAPVRNEADEAVAVPTDTGPAGATTERDSTTTPATAPSTGETTPGAFRMRGLREDGRPEHFGSTIESSLAGLARDTPAPTSNAGDAAHPATTEIFVQERAITRRRLRELRAEAEAAGEPMPLVRFGSESGAGERMPRMDAPAVPQPAPNAAGEAAPAQEPALAEEPTAAEAAVPEEAAEREEAVEPKETAEPKASAASSSSSSPDEPDEPAEPVDTTHFAEPVADVAGVVVEVPAAESPEPHAITMPEIVEIDATPIALISVEDQSDHDVVEAELIETGEPAAPDAEHADEVTLAAAGDDRAVAVPVGHWSLQATDEDENDFHDTTISRDVGVTGGGPATHALVLPTVLDQGEQLQTPIVATGEIVITGLIDVTRPESADVVPADQPIGLALPEPAPVAFAEPGEPDAAPSRAPLIIAIVGLGLVVATAVALVVIAVVYDIF